MKNKMLKNEEDSIANIILGVITIIAVSLFLIAILWQKVKD